MLMSAVLRGGKRQFGGKVSYAGGIRHKQALLCFQGAMARLLVQRFTMNREPFPDPRDKQTWRNTPVWPGDDPTSSISYTQQADCLREYLQEAGIFIRKLTHAFRMYAARELDLQGVADEVIRLVIVTF